MSRIRALAFSSRGQAGFILPGVIMFIFVLTIIGLSLFALSSYEAQFMYSTLDESQAFYNASGGLDRARFLLLASPQRLETVSNDLGPDVLYASAMQGTDSTGPVDWSSDAEPIVIRVLGAKNGKQRYLEASFQPNLSQAYKHLFSCSSTERGLFISGSSANNYPNLNTILVGSDWQTFSSDHPPAPQYDWDSDIFPIGAGSNLTVDTSFVPPPEVSQFYNDHQAAAQLVSPDSQNQLTLNAIGAPDGIKFFKTVKQSGDWSLDIDNGQPAVINVSGIAVWMFDSGFRSSRTVHVSGGPSDMLILCAVKTNDMTKTLPVGWEDVGMVFTGGLDSPNVPVILVTDGYVAIDNDPLPANPTLATVVGWMTSYANFTWIEGPDEPLGVRTYRFSHPANSGAAEDNLKKLLERGDLPNASPKQPLSLIAGSWREIQPN